ncbi:MAG: hypothetical protein ACYC1Q_06055 [Bacteroidia bacterium]
MIRLSVFFGILFFFFVLTGLILVDKAKQAYAGSQGFEAEYSSGFGRYFFYATDSNYYDTIKVLPDRSIQSVDPVMIRIQWFGKLFTIVLSLLALVLFLIQRKSGRRGVGYWLSFFGSFLFFREGIVLGTIFLVGGVPCQEFSFYHSLDIGSNWTLIKLVAGGVILLCVAYTIMMLRLLDKADRWSVFFGGGVGTFAAAVFWILFFGEWVLG